MIICDENIDAEQVELLRSWGLEARQVGADIARKGVDDHQIIPLLHSQRRCTFITWDRGFYRRELCHPRYCIVYLDVRQSEIAAYVMRLLSDPRFATKASRMGKIIRVASTGIRYWQFKVSNEQHHPF